MTRPLLRARGVGRSFASAHGESAVVLDDIHLAVAAGAFVALTGASGSGKSTLLRCLSALDRPDSGSVEFDGTDLARLDDRRLSNLRRARMGFVFQHAEFLDELTVRENVLLPALERRGAGGALTRRRAERLLDRLGVAGLRDELPAGLSGGQRQRVGICRALVNEPDVVFADEPTGALHREAAAEVVELFAELNRAGTTVVLVTHDPEVASRASAQHRLVDGRLADVAASGDDRRGRP
ncbi:MAG: ABC transporter ATP-binding protein [Microbacterium arborescens]